MMLEAMQHEASSFVTLTYRDADLPSDYSLQPGDLQGWLKRLRQRVAAREGRQIRFFAVGEYGDRTLRPHYHAALFGYAGCQLSSMTKGECTCRQCSVVRETWGRGHTMVGYLTVKSAQYITGYVAKKMTRPDNPALQGRHPEFARMSLRPGIGAGAVPDVASAIMRWKLEHRGDVPVSLRHGSNEMPLGKYLRRMLRKHVGLDENAPPEVIEALRAGLLPVQAAVELEAPHAKGEYKTVLMRNKLWDMNEQYGHNVVARQKARRRL